MIIDDLMAADRRLRLSYKLVTAMPDFDAGLARAAAEYLEMYCVHYHLSFQAVGEAYELFVARYLEDLERFQRSGLYPAALNMAGTIDRTSYDLALIMSVLVTGHRHKLMKLLMSYVRLVPTMVVGCGSGLELYLLEKIAGMHDMMACDLELTDFCVSKNPRVRFSQGPYDASHPPEQIIAMEVLEHLKEPFDLLEELLASRYSVFTTAHDLPQFDHLYNFSEHEIEVWINLRTIKSLRVETVRHQLMRNATNTYNKIYAVESGRWSN